MKKRKKRGRPSMYSPALADEILEAIATTPRGLEFICNSNERFPTARDFNKWLFKHEELVPKYARAKEQQADLVAAEVLLIADTPEIGTKEKTGVMGNIETTTGDMIEHRRLKVDARKWYAAKLAPKKYGERQTLAGDPENPLIPVGVIQRIEIPNKAPLSPHPDTETPNAADGGN